MRLNISLLFTFLISICSYTQKKEHLATYKIHYAEIDYDSIREKIEKNGDKLMLQLFIRSIAEERESMGKLKNINFTLKFNKNESIFQMEKSLLTQEKKMEKIFPLIGINNNREYYSINNKSYMNINAFGEDFNLEIGKVKWNITSETKKIGNYNCYKAVGLFEKTSYINKKDVEIVAWFTPDIPFNYGPKYYYGLPGLIINLKEGKNVTYVLKDLKTVTNQKINFKKRGRTISAEKLRKLAKDMWENRKSLN